MTSKDPEPKKLDFETHLELKETSPVSERHIENRPLTLYSGRLHHNPRAMDLSHNKYHAWPPDDGPSRLSSLENRPQRLHARLTPDSLHARAKSQETFDIQGPADRQWSKVRCPDRQNRAGRQGICDDYDELCQ